MRCSRQRTNRNLFSALLGPAAFSPMDAESSVFKLRHAAMFYSHFLSKHIRKASSKEVTESTTPFSIFFRTAQQRSIGLSSGEYGGRNITLCPKLLAILSTFFLLWKEALSIISVLPDSKDGHKNFLSHSSNNSPSIVPSYCIGSVSLPRYNAAARPVRLYFLPLIRPEILTPLFDHARSL